MTASLAPDRWLPGVRSLALTLMLLLVVAAAGCAPAPSEPSTEPDAKPPNEQSSEAEPDPEAEVEAEASAVAEAGIWVLRHGEDGGMERTLTDRGREQVAEVAELFTEVDDLLIWTSPRIRCRQTAEIVKEHAPGARLEVVDWLDHMGGLPDDWWEQLPDGPLLLVTHQPVIRGMLRHREREVSGIGHAFFERLDDQQ